MLKGLAVLSYSRAASFNAFTSIVAIALASFTVLAPLAYSATKTLPANLMALSLDRNTIADTAEKVAASVVSIQVQAPKPQPATGSNAQPASPFSPEFQQRFGGFFPDGFFEGFKLPAPGMYPPGKRGGSGVILDKAGHILTNNHVIHSAGEIEITLSDGTKLPAELVGQDSQSDLAVLKLRPAEGQTKLPVEQLHPATLGTSKSLRPGEWVLAIGNPLGLDHTVTLGIVSAVSREIQELGQQPFIQTDAAINPGNSGGPLVNLEGDVVGITTAINRRAQNIGFAIPVDTVKTIAQTLIDEGQISRPFIGVGLLEAEPKVLRSLGLPETTEGVVIGQIVPNSPAAKAGLQTGDVVQRLAGERVLTPNAVQQKVQNSPLKQPLTLQILRDGKLMVLDVTPAQRPN